MSEIKSWPNGWPAFESTVIKHDVLVGPCHCGATHWDGEFVMVEEDRGFDKVRTFIRNFKGGGQKVIGKQPQW
jgi:hypothetical protein